MANTIEPTDEDGETLYRLLRQSLEMSETIARPAYPLTSYLLRVALASLEDELQAALKAAAGDLGGA